MPSLRALFGSRRRAVHPAWRALAYTAGAGVGIGAALAVWGVLVEPRLVDWHEEAVEIPHLPPSWAGRHVALLSDLQIGARLANTGTVRRIVRRLACEPPALALLAGDLLYGAAPHPEPQVRALADLLEPLVQAGIPTFAVLGNHDYALDSAESRVEQRRVASTLRERLDAAGIRVLQNEAMPLPLPAAPADSQSEEPLYLVGIGEHATGSDRPLAAIRQVPADAPRIVFMHEPASFVALPAGMAPLALAGHTHGGQIRVPFKPEWTLARLRPAFRQWPNYRDGWIEGYGRPGNHLYVNRGIGFSDLPIRFGCPPEVTLITLRAHREGSKLTV